MLTTKHIELLEAVNNAKTESEHRRAADILHGYRMRLEEEGNIQWAIASDFYYMNSGIDRPMCCGVFLDWEPSKDGAEGGEAEKEKYHA